MATKISSLRKRKSSGFMTLLSLAACEWFLMFLMFVDAALSYLLTKFAHYCELEAPCVFCSRFDYCFGGKKPRFYSSLLCSKHREEISSLVSCSIHGKFADVHGLCEECMVPIVMQNKSDSKSCRLLVGKSWVDVDRSVLQNLMQNKSIRLGSPDRRACSCCSKAWKAKSMADRLLETNRVTDGASKANLKPPLPRAPGRSRFSHRESFKRLRDKCSGSTTPGCIGVDSVSRVGFRKRKITSHSDSEVLNSEDEGDANVGSCETCSEPDRDVQCDGSALYKPTADNAASKKKTYQRCEAKPVDQPNLLDLSEHKSISSLSSDALKENDTTDLNWEKSYNESTPSLTPELISLDDGSQAPDIAGGSFGESAVTAQSNVFLPQMPALAGLSELLSLCCDPSLSNATTIPKKMNVGETGEIGDAPAVNHTEAAAGTTSHDFHSLQSNNMHHTDYSTWSEITWELSDKHAFELISTHDSAKTEGHMKSQPQVSTSELNSLSEDTNLGAHDQIDESCADEDAYYQVLPVSELLKKKGSNYESSDGITLSDSEGESIDDRLKRQVEYDRSIINSLHKELEEERNASAVAANQAMAMITKLQEEKAAFHMEALQYLRMMEEQAEYDMEALARANDLLAEREKELQELEYELEFYRENFPDESRVHNIQEETATVDNQIVNSASVSSNSKSVKIPEASGNSGLMNGVVSNFEDSKVYISQCLKMLKKKLHQGYFSGKLDDMPNGVSSVEVSTPEDSLPSNDKLNQEKEKNSSLLRKAISVSNGILTQDTSSNGTPTHDKANGCSHEKSDKLSANQGELNSATLEMEIAELQGRLEALETDCNFLKCTSDLLQNGKDGLQLVQEIAHQLQELRKIEF